MDQVTPSRLHGERWPAHQLQIEPEPIGDRPHEIQRGSTRPVSMLAMCERDTPTAAASSRCVMSSIVRVSRHRRAKVMHSGVATPASQHDSA